MIVNEEQYRKFESEDGFGKMWYLNPREWVEKAGVVEDDSSVLHLCLTPITLRGYKYSHHIYSQGAGAICERKIIGREEIECKYCQKGHKAKTFTLYYMFDWKTKQPIILVADKRLADAINKIMEHEDLSPGSKYYNENNDIIPGNMISELVQDRSKNYHQSLPTIDIEVRNSLKWKPGDGVKYSYSVERCHLYPLDRFEDIEEYREACQGFNPLFIKTKDTQPSIDTKFDFYSKYIEEHFKMKERRKQAGHKED